MLLNAIALDELNSKISVDEKKSNSGLNAAQISNVNLFSKKDAYEANHILESFLKNDKL